MTQTRAETETMHTDRLTTDPAAAAITPRTVVFIAGENYFGRNYPGGWAAIIVHPDGRQDTFKGQERRGSEDRLKLLAIAAALEALPPSTPLAIDPRGGLIYKSLSRQWLKAWRELGWVTKSGKPVQDHDAWERVDDLAAGRDITWGASPAHAAVTLETTASELAVAERHVAEQKWMFRGDGGPEADTVGRTIDDRAERWERYGRPLWEFARRDPKGYCEYLDRSFQLMVAREIGADPATLQAALEEANTTTDCEVDADQQENDPDEALVEADEVQS